MDEYIKKSIVSFIKNDYEKVICVSGEWGVGKTYLVLDVLKKRKRVIYKYGSVFGIKSIDDLIVDIICYSKINTTAMDIIKSPETRKTIGDFINKMLDEKIGIKFNMSLVPYFGEKIAEFCTDNKKVVIVIDDIERISAELNLSELMGFISKYRELKNIKFVLIANESKVADSRCWKEYKEKIVDRTFHLKEPTRSIYFSILKIRETEESSKLLDNNLIFTITNLRTLLTLNNIIKINKLNILGNVKRDNLLIKLIVFVIDNINNAKYGKDKLFEIKSNSNDSSFELGLISSGKKVTDKEKNDIKNEIIENIKCEISKKDNKECLFEVILEIKRDTFAETGLIEGKRLLYEMYDAIASGQYEKINNIEISWLKKNKEAYIDNNSIAFFSKTPKQTAMNSLSKLKCAIDDDSISKMSVLEVYMDLLSSNFEKYYGDCIEILNDIEKSLIYKAAKEIVVEKIYINNIHLKAEFCEYIETKKRMIDVLKRFYDSIVEEFNNYYVNTFSERLLISNDLYAEIHNINAILYGKVSFIINDDLCKKLFDGYCNILSKEINMSKWVIIYDNIVELSKYNSGLKQLIIERMNNCEEPLKERMEIIYRNKFDDKNR